MRLDPRTAAVTLAIAWLTVSALSAIVWWTRRRYAGFGYFAIAGPGTVLALLLLSLRHAVPDWVSVLAANAVLVLASVLYLEGARAFRSLPARRWSVYAGGLVTIAAVAFFAYVVPSLNARAAAMSAYLAVLCLLTAGSLLRAVPPGQVHGLRLTGIVFALCGATHVARAAERGRPWSRVRSGGSTQKPGPRDHQHDGKAQPRRGPDPHRISPRCRNDRSRARAAPFELNVNARQALR